MKQRLSDSVEAYLSFRVSQGLAKQTQRNDRSVLTALLTEVGNIYCENIHEGHITDFLAEQATRRNNNSLANDVTCLNQFFVWAKRTRRVPAGVDPMAGRKAPKRTTRERTRVHVSLFPSLLDTADSRTPRDRAFIALCLYTCCRTSEITTLRVNDLDLSAGYLHTRIWKSRLEDKLGIPTELDYEMRRWLTYYASQCGSLKPDWYLVPSRRLITMPGVCGKDAEVRLRPTSPPTHTGSLIVKPALEGIGFTVPGRPDLKGEGAHTLRRSAARALFDRLVADGYDHALSIVKAQLHHANQSMTEHYIGVSADRFARDNILKGKPMFGLPEVTTLRSVSQA